LNITNKTLYPLLIIIFIFSFVLASEYSWNEVEKLCLSNNADIITARENLLQGEYSEIVARSGLWPKLSTSAGYQKSKNSANNLSDSYSLGLSLSQLLFDWDKTGYDISKSQYAYLGTKEAYKSTLASTGYKLRVAFINVLRYQELQNIYREILQRRKQQMELISLRYDGGREHKGALLTAKANLADAEENLEETKRSLTLSLRKLELVMGVEKQPQTKVTTKLVIKEPEPLTPELLVSANSSFLQYYYNTKSKELNLKSLVADRLPAIATGVSYGLNDNTFFPGKESWSFSLNLSYLILDGGQKDAQEKIAISQYQQALTAERNAKLLTFYTIQEAWYNFISAYKNVGVQKKFLEAITERAKIADIQYNSGQMSYDNWMLIENDLINTQKNNFNARIDYLLGEAGLIQAKGEGLNE